MWGGLLDFRTLVILPPSRLHPFGNSSGLKSASVIHSPAKYMFVRLPAGLCAAGGASEAEAAEELPANDVGKGMPIAGFLASELLAAGIVGVESPMSASRLGVSG